jgi:integration host factor subunit beta
MRPENPEWEEAGVYQPGRLAKSGLAEAVAESIEINLGDAGRIVDVIFDSIVQALQSGDRVELRGLGVFGIRERRERRARNPKTGDAVAVPAKRVVFFALSRRLAKTLNRV